MEPTASPSSALKTLALIKKLETGFEQFRHKWVQIVSVTDSAEDLAKKRAYERDKKEQHQKNVTMVENLFETMQAETVELIEKLKDSDDGSKNDVLFSFVRYHELVNRSRSVAAKLSRFPKLIADWTEASAQPYPDTELPQRIIDQAQSIYRDLETLKSSDFLPSYKKDRTDFFGPSYLNAGVSVSAIDETVERSVDRYFVSEVKKRLARKLQTGDERQKKTGSSASEPTEQTETAPSSNVTVDQDPSAVLTKPLRSAAEKECDSENTCSLSEQEGTEDTQSDSRNWLGKDLRSVLLDTLLVAVASSLGLDKHVNSQSDFHRYWALLKIRKQREYIRKIQANLEKVSRNPPGQNAGPSEKEGVDLRLFLKQYEQLVSAFRQTLLTSEKTNQRYLFRQIQDLCRTGRNAPLPLLSLASPPKKDESGTAPTDTSDKTSGTSDKTSDTSDKTSGAPDDAIPDLFRRLFLLLQEDLQQIATASAESERATIEKFGRRNFLGTR